MYMKRRNRADSKRTEKKVQEINNRTEACTGQKSK